jgi:hypothetical protein
MLDFGIGSKSYSFISTRKNVVKVKSENEQSLSPLRPIIDINDKFRGFIIKQPQE